jgi:hypothetical protein
VKVTLEFTLPDESAEHRQAMYASVLASTIWDIDAMLRNIIKYGDNRFKTAESLAEYIRREHLVEALNKIE